MLYHLSFDVLETIGEFIPRVPEQRMAEEDNTSLRICCTDTIEGALLAMPDNRDFLISTKLFPLVKVYELDESKIEKGNLLSPNEIKDKVPDAVATGEHWITTAIEPSNFYTIQVTNLSYDENSRTVSNLIYHKLTQEEEAELGDCYCFDIRVEATEETLIILDEEIVEDEEIYDIDDLLSKANNLIENTIYYISSEPVFRSTDIDNGFELHIDGYFMGEYRDRAFVHQEKEVVEEVKRELSILVSQYKLSLEFL